MVERLRPWLASLRSAVAGLHVIATSTTPLAFTDEHLVVVPPLDPPDAIQLLRRVAGRRGTPLDDVGDGELADLVTLVDGLPLGLELAAGCLRTLPLDALLAGLTEPGGLAALDVPAGGGGLEPLLARAVDRLAPAPRDALPQLAFLGGAFTGEIAAAALGRSTVATLPVLQQLVDVSLLMREPHGNTGHFRFLHVVRSHVRDHGDHDLAVAAQARFVQNAAVIATELETALSGPMSLANARRLHQWFPHLLAAARHAIDHDQVEVAAGILPMASWWADTARTGPEVDTLADRLLAHPGFTTHPRRGDLLAARALLHLLGGRADRCRDLAEQALDTPPGAFTPALAHVALGMALLFDGDITAATAHLEACIEQATAAGMPALADYARLQRAMVTARTETFGAAVTACREIVERATREGDVLIGTCASAFESYLLLAIDPEAARATAELAIPVSEEVGDAWTCASLRMSAGVSAALTGDTRGGARWLGDSLRRLLDQGDLPEAQLCVLYASVILDRLGDSRAAQIVASVTSMGEIHDAAFSREEAELLAPALAAVDATTAPALGTPALLALTLAALDDHAGDGQPSGGTDRASLRRAGHAWEVTFDGVTVTLPSRKGLGDLARLLATPDQEIHCLELMGAGAAVGDMGPDIDERAIGAYRDRLHALEEFIEGVLRVRGNRPAKRTDTVAVRLAMRSLQQSFLDMEEEQRSLQWQLQELAAELRA